MNFSASLHGLISEGDPPVAACHQESSALGIGTPDHSVLQAQQDLEQRQMMHQQGLQITFHKSCLLDCSRPNAFMSHVLACLSSYSLSTQY